MQTRKDAAKFPHLAGAAAIWHKHFPNPIRALSALNSLAEPVGEFFAIKLKQRDEDAFDYHGAFYMLNQLVEQIVIPALDATQLPSHNFEDVLQRSIANCIEREILAYQDVVRLFNCIGVVNDRYGDPARDVMVGIIETLRHLSELCAYCDENAEAIMNEAKAYLKPGEHKCKGRAAA